jgi:hypothetical protein
MNEVDEADAEDLTADVSDEVLETAASKHASTSGSRSPARIARIIRKPVEPVMSATTWWS